MGSYTAGTTVDLTASVQDDRGNYVSDTVSWTSDQGTVTPGPDGTDASGNVCMTATLVNAPVGTANVVATTSNGVAFTDAIEFTDPNAGIPASITVTDTAAPAATPAA